MRTIARACLAVLVAVGAAAAAAAPAAAEVTPPAGQYGCLDQKDGYGAPLPCELVVTDLTPTCVDDVALLNYAVQAVGTPNTTVTLTFVNPDGASVVMSDLPLSGQVRWPGMVVGADGKGIDWPGWKQLEDGTWIETDDGYSWVRPTVSVKLQVNPEATVAVTYPPSSPQCLTSPPTTVVLADSSVSTSRPAIVTAVLAATGSEVMPFVVVALALLVVGGTAVVVVARSRARDAHR
ncbi:peptidase [Cellulomonas soli]|uniref:peptidase n=1 Tax=Cellulomonas soli TaxID=931535 RepID=UPI003F83DA13